MVTFQTAGIDGAATLPDVRSAALERLSPEVADFLEGGAGDEVTLAANRRAFDRWAFVQRVMSGRETPRLAGSFLGVPLELPVLTAPFGADRLFDAEGQVAVARANAAEGTASIVPEAGSFAIETVAREAAPAARFAQLHPMGPVDNFLRMLGRIERAGYSGVCLTLDCPTGGWRERIIRNGFDLDESYVSGNYPVDSGVELEQVFGQLFERGGTVWSWDGLADLMRGTRLPWIAKGIMTGADAESALAAGASALYVSNHGGRQLDGVPASLEALVEVRRAVGPGVPIAFDSGVRRGADVVKAVALGADVVVIGRLAAYGLAVGGRAGVEHVLRLLRDEIRTILTLLGRGDLGEVGPDAVRPVGRS